MKRSFLVIISLMSFLFLMGAKDSQQVTESLSGLEKFLSNWATTIDTLEKKVGIIEERIAKESQVKDAMLKTLSNIDQNLIDLNERLKKVEKLPTFFSEMPTETLGKTLRFYNESIADLKKQIEEQQVITSVLEKKYQEAQKPLEPVMKEIADVRKQIIDMSQKVDQNAVMIDDIQKNLQSIIVDSITVTLQEYEKIFMTLSQRIENMEKHIGITPPVEVAEKEEKPEAEKPEGAEQQEVAEAEAKEAAPKTPEDEGFRDIGLGFYIKGVTFESFGSSTTLSGDIKNYSNRDYSIAEFSIKVYNAEDLLIGSDEFSIKGFKNGAVKTFRQIITGVEPKKISSYSINFNKRY